MSGRKALETWAKSKLAELSYEPTKIPQLVTYVLALVDRDFPQSTVEDKLTEYLHSSNFLFLFLFFNIFKFMFIQFFKYFDFFVIFLF
jgi:hypothetical protein